MKKSEIEAYVKAGEIAKEVKKFVLDLVRPKMKLIDIAEAIDDKILELGGQPAFPVNLGLNEVAAHYTPTSKDETIAEGILKIDLGVAIDGFVADSAISIDLTEDGEFKEMIALNSKILEKASEVVKVGMKVSDVGNVCQDVFEKAGKNEFSIIKSLSGHGLEQYIIHSSPTIPNYRNDNGSVLKNQAFAIEPFVTTGVGDVIEGKAGGIYVLKSDGQVRDRDAREVLEFIRDNYETLPFCERWLEKQGFSKLKFVLSILVRQGILHEYPILVEKSRAPVSQMENTFLITNDGVICTTE